MSCTNLTYIFKSYGLPTSEASMIAVSVFISILAVVGIVGNVITIIVIAQSKRLKSVFYLLIMSLCVSDLTSALVSFNRMYCFTWASCIGPESLAAVKWVCRVGWRITNWMTFNTAMHITGFAAFRFTSIKWPSWFHKLTAVRIKIFIVTSWIVSFVCGFVVVFITSVRIDRITAYIVVYLIFTALMAFLCLGTAVLILKQRGFRKNLTGKRSTISDAEKARRSKENMKVLQLALIIGSFLLGYVPRAVFNINVIYMPASLQGINAWDFSLVQYFCLRVSECLNPVFYNIGSRELYDETKVTLKNCWLYGKCTGKQRVEAVEMSTSARIL